jgi:hypothetical protein
MMRKRKTKLAQADGCAMRLRSAWKKTPVPAPAAPRKAIRNCVEESSPTGGHGTGKPLRLTVRGKVNSRSAQAVKLRA